MSTKWVGSPAEARSVRESNNYLACLVSIFGCPAACTSTEEKLKDGLGLGTTEAYAEFVYSPAPGALLHSNG